MFRFACPNCKSALRTNDTSHGAIVTCPGCTQRMRIPPTQLGEASEEGEGPESAPQRGQRERARPSRVKSRPKQERRKKQRSHSGGFLAGVIKDVGKSLLGLIFFVVLNVVLCSGYLAWMHFRHRDQPPPQQFQPPPVEKVTAAQVLKAYRDNEEAANQEYQGKLLEITGLVDQVSKDQPAGPSVTLQGGNDADKLRIQCIFDEDDEDQPVQLPDLPRGKSVTIRGACMGKSGNVVIRGCVLVPAANPLPGTPAS